MLPLSQKPVDRNNRMRVVSGKDKDGEIDKISKLTHSSVRALPVSVEDEDRSTQIRLIHNGMVIF